MNSAQKFEKVTIFIFAANETNALRETVNSICTECSDEDLEEILIVAKNTECPSYSEAKKIIFENNNPKIKLYVQKAPTIELCAAELPPMVKSSHFVIMVGDMEMNPKDLKVFIQKAKKHPQRIICAAKWHKDSQIIGYGNFREFGSRMMNSFISILFGRNVKDPFSVYQIYPISVYNQMNFDKPESFAFEYTLKPLRCGIEYEEIPTVYRNRVEGKTNFNYKKLFSTAILFCLTAVRLRFSSKKKLLASDDKNK